MWNLKKQHNEQTKTSPRQRTIDGCLMGWVLGDCMRKVRGLRSINWLLWKQSWGCKYSRGNIVNNTVIALYGVRWVLYLRGSSLHTNVNHCFVHLKLMSYCMSTVIEKEKNNALSCKQITPFIQEAPLSVYQTQSCFRA